MLLRHFLNVSDEVGALFYFFGFLFGVMGASGF